jgi:hypothetical protein
MKNDESRTVSHLNLYTKEHMTKVNQWCSKGGGYYEEEGSESVRNNALRTYIHDSFCFKSKITAHSGKVAVILKNKRG